MLHLIPKPLHRLAYRLAHGLRKRWWRIARSRLTGCRVLAFDGEGRVLLVRHSYGSGRWMFPGGGVAKGEDPAAAAARELLEETGCRLAAPLAVARIEEVLHGSVNVVHIFAGQAAGTPRVDHREIVEARFFAPDALPEDMPAALRDGASEWIRAAKAGRPAPPFPSLDSPPPPSPAPTG